MEDVSDSSVTVSWEPPERLGRLGLQGYMLELRREGGELRVKPLYTEGRWAWGAVRDKPPDSAVESEQREMQSGSGGSLLKPHGQRLAHLRISESRRASKGPQQVPCPPASGSL